MESDSQWRTSVAGEARGKIPLSREQALAFSRMLLAGGIPAWQRQQAIRTLAAYGDLVLVSEVPLLSDMARKRGSIAEQERSFGSA